MRRLIGIVAFATCAGLGSWLLDRSALGAISVWVVGAAILATSFRAGRRH